MKSGVNKTKRRNSCKKQKKAKLSRSKPIDFGSGTENLSEKVDEILYK